MSTEGEARQEHKHTNHSVSLRVQGGFANRLRAIVSAALWAEDLGRKLVIYWPVEPGHMPCSLEEIFVVGSIPGLCCVHKGYLSSAHQVLKEDDMAVLVSMYKDTEDIRIDSYSVFHADLRQLTARGQAALRQIRIQPRLETLADSLWKKAGGQTNWIAVHFRGTDHKKCLAASPFETFVEAIRTILKQIPGQKFLLCTDEYDVSETLQAMFGPETIAVPVIVRGRRLPEQQMLGVIDWLLMQRCTDILASAGSSFSETAAWRSGGQLIPLLAAGPTRVP